MRIEGHTDNVGQPAANLKLSGGRALAVKTWLTNKGIDAKRMIAIGFGDTKPVADNAKEEGRSQNRRTEFVVVEKGSAVMTIHSDEDVQLEVWGVESDAKAFEKAFGRTLSSNVTRT